MVTSKSDTMAKTAISPTCPAMRRIGSSFASLRGLNDDHGLPSTRTLLVSLMSFIFSLLLGTVAAVQKELPEIPVIVSSILIILVASLWLLDWFDNHAGCHPSLVSVRLVSWSEHRCHHDHEGYYSTFIMFPQSLRTTAKCITHYRTKHISLPLLSFNVRTGRPKDL